MKGADLGRGRGPCTVHVSFRLEETVEREVAFETAAEGSSSRYAEPEADGVRPVLRTKSIVNEMRFY